MRINLDADNQEVIDSLTSPSRQEILRLLSIMDGLSTTDIMEKVHLTKSVVSRHMSKMEVCGLVTHRLEKGVRGTRKLYSLSDREIIISLECHPERAFSQIKSSIGVGEYEHISVKPPCGLAKSGLLMGLKNDERFFSGPLCHRADEIWFSKGEVTYHIPFDNINIQNAVQLEMSFDFSMDEPVELSDEFVLRLMLGTNNEILYHIPAYHDVKCDDERLPLKIKCDIFERKIYINGSYIGKLDDTAFSTPSVTIGISEMNLGVTMHLFDKVTFEIRF